MILTYSVGDAEQWAAFSGDYNPIHFDQRHAQALGGDDLSVHGMRAMLDMKRFLSEALLQAGPQADDYTFSARLRHPLMCRRPYQMALNGQPDGRRVSAQLQDVRDGHVCFAAKLAAAAAPVEIATRANAFTFSAPRLYQLSELFPLTATEPATQWGFLDAVLFQRIVEAPDTLSMVQQHFPSLRASSLIDVFSRVPVVQTHHEVHFSARLFTPDTGFYAGEGMHCAIQPALVMGSRESGLIISIVIQAWTAAQPLLATTVTLKTLPLQASSTMTTKGTDYEPV